MLRIAFIFLAIGLVVALLGFNGVVGASAEISKFFAILFGLLFLGFLLFGLTGQSRVTT